MGIAPSSQCGTSPAAALSRCHRECSAHCTTDVVTGTGGKLKLCSWVEEEVSLYGAFGPPNPGADSWATVSRGAAGSGSRPRARPLLDPGSFIRVHGSGKGDAANSASLGLDSMYTLDKAAFGRGSYGEVHTATHHRTGMRRAVKSVGKMGLRRYVSDVSAFVRREVDILRRLDHPNIVRLYEAFEDQSALYLVLELCEGGDLLERVAVARDRLPEREAAMLMAQMLGAMQHLYLRGIVHRDVKPENFLFSRREPEREPLPPERSPLKLIDFGLSRRLSFEAGIRVTPKIGTTEYMAPEAYAGRVNTVLADRTDMWSIGVVLHVIFIGHFPSPRLAEMTTEDYLSLPCWSRVSPHGRQLLGQLLRQEPTQRPTVTVAMKHPWLASAFACGRDEPVRSMPTAVRAFASSPGLRRLALLAAAREAEDCEVGSVRRLFQVLELECDGALSRQALERAAWLPGCAGVTATELARHFDALDCSGSGTVEWSELLAAAFGLALSGDSEGTALDAMGALVDSTSAAASAAVGSQGERWGCQKAFGGGASRGGGGMPPTQGHANSQQTPALALPAPQDAALWSAFDLLAGGGETVSGPSLAQLLQQPRTPASPVGTNKFCPLSPRDDSDMQERFEHGGSVLGPPAGPQFGAPNGVGAGTSGATGAGGTGGQGDACGRIEDYGELVREVHPGGALDPRSFMALARGRTNLAEDTGGTTGGGGMRSESTAEGGARWGSATP